jgi:hypothetical protein
MRHTRAARAMSIAIVALVTASCQSGSVAKAPTVSSSAGAQSGCGTERRFLPTQKDLPGFTEYVQYPKMPWPGTSLPGHPSSLQLQYVCGEFNGFIASIALTGVYRQENNEQAKQSGYPLEKWPYTPLNGQIVQQNQHRTLEIYTTVFQFKSTQAAEQFVGTGKPFRSIAPAQVHDRQLPVSPLPGSVVTTEYEGADIPSDESTITIRAPIGYYAVTLDLQGGTDLDWSDVLPYWMKINSLLKPLESGQ